MTILDNILFLGCGKMGSIIARNLLEDGEVDSSRIQVLEKSLDHKIPNLNYAQSIDGFDANYQADVVFVTIKPQACETILKELAASQIIHSNTIFISILAGKDLAFLANLLGQEAKIIRSMPNLPIEYGQGIFPYLCNAKVADEEREAIHDLVKQFGIAFAIKDESSFDQLTALFGSGPAYIFLLQEILEKLAINLGIEAENATKLVKKLFLGSALMSNFSKHDFTSLRESVTSKAGVTDAALQVFQKDNALETLLSNAIDAAIQRSKEL